MDPFLNGSQLALNINQTKYNLFNFPLPAGFSDKSAKVPLSKTQPSQSHPLLCATPTSQLNPMEEFLSFLKATYHGTKFATYLKESFLSLGATHFTLFLFEMASYILVTLLLHKEILVQSHQWIYFS